MIKLNLLDVMIKHALLQLLYAGNFSQSHYNNTWCKMLEIRCVITLVTCYYNYYIFLRLSNLACSSLSIALSPVPAASA